MKTCTKSGFTMKLLKLLTFSLSLLAATTVLANELENEIEEHDDGLYSQAITIQYGKAIYVVDTRMQSCFGAGLLGSEIPCATLKKRNEWKPIITWIKD
jgi:hypothetical protein